MELNDYELSEKCSQYFLDRNEDNIIQSKYISKAPLVYISLTSIQDRQESLIKFLQNLKSQTYINIRISVWLSKGPYLLDEGFNKCSMIPELSKFLANNPDIELHWVPNTGSFRKLLPLLEKMWGKDQLICTVDDDVILDKRTIEIYVNEYLKTGYRICSRGSYLSLPDGKQITNLTNFKSFKSRDIIAIGSTATLYNAKWFTDRRILDYDLYNEICPTDDDLWFHCWLVESDHITHCIDSLKHIDICPQNSLYFKIHSDNRGEKRTIDSIQILKTKYSMLTDKVSVIPISINIPVAPIDISKQLTIKSTRNTMLSFRKK